MKRRPAKSHTRKTPRRPVSVTESPLVLYDRNAMIDVGAIESLVAYRRKDALSGLGKRICTSFDRAH
ncbi:MAG: hypothetical protein U0Y68_20270 [Blastocatellia bacterium]